MALEHFISRKRNLVLQTVLCHVESQMTMGQTSAVLDE